MCLWICAHRGTLFIAAILDETINTVKGKWFSWPKVSATCGSLCSSTTRFQWESRTFLCGGRKPFSIFNCQNLFVCICVTWVCQYLYVCLYMNIYIYIILWIQYIINKNIYLSIIVVMLTFINEEWFYCLFVCVSLFLCLCLCLCRCLCLCLCLCVCVPVCVCVSVPSCVSSMILFVPQQVPPLHPLLALFSLWRVRSVPCEPIVAVGLIRDTLRPLPWFSAPRVPAG